MKIFCTASTISIVFPRINSSFSVEYALQLNEVQYLITTVPFQHSERGVSIHCMLEWQKEGHIQRQSQRF